MKYIPHIVIKQKDEFAQELGNRHGLYHAAQCYGWLCPCGHHSISAVGPVPNCASCRKANPARVFAGADEEEEGEISVSKYEQSIERYIDVLRGALELAEDPYKPPELTVHLSSSVVKAAWELQVQYAALTLSPGRKKSGAA